MNPAVGAARRGHAQCLQTIMEAGPSILKRRYRKQGYHDALNTAIRNGHRDCIQMLTKAGVDVNLRCDNLTPLNVAAGNGKKEILELLIEKGADVNKIHFTPAIFVAAYFDRYDCVDVLLKTGADVNASTLMMTAQCGKNTCLIQLLQAGADVNATGDKGCPALYLASISGHVSCVNTLIQAGANVNIKTKLGESVLCSVVREICCLGTEISQKFNRIVNLIECVKLLLQAGAEVNLVEPKNSNSLCYLFYLMNIWGIPIYRTMVLLLYAAGETLDDINVDESEENTRCVLEYLDKGEICLKVFCREAIRKHLLAINLHDNLFGRVPRLGLPQILTQYMLFNLSLNEAEQ